MLRALCLVSCVLSLLLPSSRAYKIDKSVHPEHPHECWDKEVNAFYQLGSYNQRPGKCEMIRCYQDHTMDSVGCHTKELKSGCSASPQDFSKSYPDCCPRISCTPTPSPAAQSNKIHSKAAQTNSQTTHTLQQQTQSIKG